MTKICVCFYTNQKFRSREFFLNDYYSKKSFDVFPFRSEDIKQSDFYEKNKEVMDCETGDGYWLWKPKIILDCMLKLNDNDVVVYTDAGDLVDITYNDILEFSKTNDYYFTNWGGSRWPQKICTKRDCFLLMDCDYPKYHEASQMEAGFLIFKKTAKNIELLNEYLHYCSIKDIVSNEPNKFGTNFENWQFHRNDQSILTNLLVKHNYTFNTCFDDRIRNNIYKP